MLRRPLCATVLVALLIGGCGGSIHSSSSTSSPAASSSTTVQSTSTGTVSAGPSTTTATSAAPPEVPNNRASKHSKPTAPNTNVRIPATFIIRSGGALTPPLISAPADVTIELRLRNEDSKAHRVQLTVPHFPPEVSVPAGASATSEITGVRKGTYRLLVDGAAKGRIVVGAVPGP